jgi:hypothetical protein
MVKEDGKIALRSGVDVIDVTEKDKSTPQASKRHPRIPECRGENPRPVVSHSQW